MQNLQMQYIQPGKSQQNAYVERYNRTIQYKWLSQHVFDSIKHIQNYGADWLWSYNHESLYMALGSIHQE